jgi:hypothetical protein
MHRFLLFVIFETAAVVGYSQGSISLEPYCPKKAGQYNATCFAYATTYTALSIMYNVKNQVTDEASPGFVVFSDGFVASKIKKDKRGFNRVFNRCGKYATADKALGVLLEHGTVLKKDFPDGCNAAAVDGFMERAARYKIRDTVNISKSSLSDQEYIAAIIEALKKQQPVVTAIFQDELLRANTSPEFDIPDTHSTGGQAANHVVCIVGFDSAVNGGSFLVKNNYTSWGRQGFSHIPYADFLKFVRYAYAIEI